MTTILLVNQLKSFQILLVQIVARLMLYQSLGTMCKS